VKAPEVFRAPVDAKSLLVAGGGAAVMASADALLETIYGLDPEGWRQKFPFLSVSLRVPPLDDWLLALVPAAILAAGAYTMNPLLAYFGLGGLLYGGGVVVKDVIMRNIPFLLEAMQGTSAQYADGAKRVSNRIGTYT